MISKFRLILFLIVSATLFSAAHANDAELDNFLNSADGQATNFVNEYNALASTRTLDNMGALLRADLRAIEEVDSEKLSASMGEFFSQQLQKTEMGEDFDSAIGSAHLHKKIGSWVRSIIRNHPADHVDMFQMMLFQRLVAETDNREALWFILKGFQEQSIGRAQNTRRGSVTYNMGVAIKVGLGVTFTYLIIKNTPRNREGWRKLWAGIRGALPKLTNRLLARRKLIRRQAAPNSELAAIADQAATDSQALERIRLATQRLTKELKKNDEFNASGISNPVAGAKTEAAQQGSYRYTPFTDMRDRFLLKFPYIQNRPKLRAFLRFMYYPTLGLGGAGLYGWGASEIRAQGLWSKNWWLAPTYEIFPRETMDSVVGDALVLKLQCNARSFLTQTLPHFSAETTKPAQFRGLVANLKQLLSSYVFLRAVSGGAYNKQLIIVRGGNSEGTYAYEPKRIAKTDAYNVKFIRKYKSRVFEDTFTCPDFALESHSQLAISLAEAAIDIERARHTIMRIQIEQRLQLVAKTNFSDKEKFEQVKKLAKATFQLNGLELEKLLNNKRNNVLNFPGLIKELLAGAK